MLRRHRKRREFPARRIRAPVLGATCSALFTPASPAARRSSICAGRDPPPLISPRRIDSRVRTLIDTAGEITGADLDLAQMLLRWAKPVDAGGDKADTVAARGPGARILPG